MTFSNTHAQTWNLSMQNDSMLDLGRKHIVHLNFKDLAWMMQTRDGVRYILVLENSTKGMVF